MRQLAGRHDRAPQATGHVDRSSHHRVDPELAQPLRELALHVVVVVHALGAPASVELRGHRPALDRDALAERERRRVVPRPGADNRREALVLVANHVGALHREQLPELFAHPYEEGWPGGAAGHDGRDSAQRGLLREKRLELCGVVVAAHRKPTCGAAKASLAKPLVDALPVNDEPRGLQTGGAVSRSERKRVRSGSGFR